MLIKSLKVVGIGVATLLILSVIGSRLPSPPSTTPHEVVKELSNLKEQTPSDIQEKNIKIKTIDLANARVVHFYGEVEKMLVDSTIKKINDFNKQSKEPIYLLLDSPGGSVFDGARLIATIQASKSPIVSVNLDMCASMCAMILSHTHKRYALDYSTLMFHSAHLRSQVSGDVDRVNSRFMFLKRFIDKMDHYVAKRAGKDFNGYKMHSMQEIWLDAEDALSNKYIDGIVYLENVPETQDFFMFENIIRKRLDVRSLWLKN